MQCASCATENPERAEFCLNCGARLALTCPQCGTEGPLQARFCLACGARLAAHPPQAGPTLGERPPAPEGNASYLQRLVPKEYAERLLASRGQASRERRTVTILFCDVEGSTAMAEDLDPEDVMEIMDGAFDVLIEPVYRYEGTLARLMGDAVLAFFGAPIAHEDDAQRAVLAALDIIAGAQEYATRLERERGVRGFNVRVGINTGLVVVGEVGSDLRVEYTAMGDAVNLAARMESAAEPGTVLVSEGTHKLVAPLFETEALGPVEVKGKAEPVAVYRVLASREVSGKLRGIAGLESPLVGREAELGALADAVDRLRTGAGGIVTLVGEAGIGKSRLVAEVRKQALNSAVDRGRSPSGRGVPPNSLVAPVSEQTPSSGAFGATRGPDSGVDPGRSPSGRGPGAMDEVALQWVEGGCLSYGTSIAYLLWLDVLRGLLGVTAEEAPRDVGVALRAQVETLCPHHFEEVHPYLAALMSVPLETEVEARLAQLDGQQVKAGTFQAVETLLGSAASERPVILVCEDLHWADPTSMALLEKLLGLTERAALLLICVFRPEREHRSWRLRELAARDHGPRHTDVWLDALSQAESERLVGNLLWIDHLPEQLKGRVLERAEGNPFYLEEVLRSLIDEGAIEQEAGTGRWLATREVAEIAIPDTLQGVLTARIDRLEEETKRVLRMASVIGRLFLYRVLAEIAREERGLESRLFTLQQEEMVRERARLPELEYIFKHELTREAAYNGLLKKERRAFHRQVAEALERLFPEREEEQVGLLAHHWERAGDAEKATEYLLRAGDQARLAYAHEEAAGFYQRALVFLKDAGEHERAARTLMQLGLTYDAAFDFPRARQAYEEGFALWQRAGEAGATASLPPAPYALRDTWADPLTVDPAFASDEAAISIVEQLFSGLVDTTSEMGIVPDVAASWKVSQAGVKVVFHLRDDVSWSDGVPVTAHDFEYAWKRVLDPATGSRNASLLYDIKGARAYHEGRISVPDGVGVQALDDVTLAVELEAPTGYLLHLLAFTAAYPVPRHVLEQRGATWTDPESIVTNGPFSLKSWQRGDSMVFERYPQYHGRFTGNVQRVELSRAGDDWHSALEWYEDDLLHIVGLATGDPKEADRVRQRHAKEYLTQPDARTHYLAFDVTRPPFDDPRVRQAFAYAVDREAMENATSSGYRLPATGGLVPPGMPGHAAGIALPYDPQRGRQLAAEAGYPGGEGFPEVELLAPGGLRAEAPYLQALWRENLGVEIRWKMLPWAEFTDRVFNSPPHLILVGWIPDYPDPDSYLRVAVERHTAWREERYLSLVERARRAMDPQQRMALYAQAEQILVEQVPLLPLHYGRLHLLVKPWVKRYRTSAMSGFFWKDVVIEPH
jgi:ABC-type oligopeptide transport system substrate-binding subunit/class 3 adenylate cyclase